MSFTKKFLAGHNETDNTDNYAAPIYNVEKDHVFEFKCSEDVGLNPYNAFSVYTNDSFGKYGGLTINISYDKDTSSIRVSPDSSFKMTDTGVVSTKDGTWGAFRKIYLVQNIDLQTGEKLEKPIITPFTVKSSIDAPVISQKVGDNNHFQLNWSPVPGATKYQVYQVINNDVYDLEAETTNTMVDIDEFASQKKDQNYESLVEKDLENWGYEKQDSVNHKLLNTSAQYYDGSGYYCVVAYKDGEYSQVSNFG